MTVPHEDEAPARVPAAAPAPAAGASLQMAEVLGVFAFASDLAFGLELDDAARSCFVATRIAERMGLSPDDRLAVYYTALLKDAGCTCWNSELAALWMTDEIAARRELLIFGDPQSLPSFLAWVARHAGSGQAPLARLGRAVTVVRRQREVMAEGFETACEVSARIAARLGLPPSVQAATSALFEQWDGHGAPHGLLGEQIPLAARVVHPTFFLVPFHRTRGRAAARELARGRRGYGFEPAVVDAFLALAEEAEFWETLESPDIWSIVTKMEPASPLAAVDDARFDAIALAFADFTDLKSPYVLAHSRRVADLAGALAESLGWPVADVIDVRRAALVHDLGEVAIPSFILNQPANALSAADRERLRLHPYHSERILERVAPMAHLARIVGMHHERLDGQGYYRGVPAALVPAGSRVLAVAARYDELTHDAPGRPALTRDDALRMLADEARGAFAPEMVEALAATLGAREASPQPPAWPAGLTDREVEVLRLAARALTRREIAERLVLSEHTVRHHLEHIYNKIGVSTRVAATLFAMEQGLLE